MFNKRISKLIFITLLISILTITPLGFSAPRSAQARNDFGVMPSYILSGYHAVQSDLTISDEEKIKSAVDTWFRIAYEERKLSQRLDFSPIASSFSLKVDGLKTERDHRDIRLMQTTLGLNFEKYTYSLKYDALKIDHDSALVSVTESHEVVFAVSSPEISKMDGLVHKIALQRDGSEWRIVADVYQDEVTQLMESLSTDKIINNINDEQLATLRGGDVPRRLPNLRHRPVRSLHSYDRTAAVNYADTWWNTSSSNYNTTFNYYVGNNCTNYTSQAVYAGSGNTQSTGYGANDWHFKPDTGPWIRVAEFQPWVTANTNRGPYGVSSTQCNITNGDIIQFNNGTSWYHGVIVVAITAPYPNQCTNKGVIMIDSNTNNYYHYPLTTYAGAADTRFIKISGWRD